ncbi:MAG: class A beta-lactamase [Gemmatimonadaceae bacterium]
MMHALVLAAAIAGRGAPDTSLARLGAELRRAAAESGGTMGASVLHLESGARIAIRGAERFPMQSTYKVAIAMQLLHRAELGQLSLDSSVRILASDLRLGRSPLADSMPHGGGTRTVRQLVELMVAESDNTASDLVMKLAGGPAAVTARLRALGVSGVRVDRQEGDLALDFFGVRHAPPEREWTRARLDSLATAVPAAERRRSLERYLADPRDTATPDGEVALLRSLWSGAALDAAQTGWLLAVMTRSRGGERRLQAGVPPATPVAHKTGTSGVTGGVHACVNDAGIITLPGSRGHVVVAVFVKRSTRAQPQIERAIADVARAVYEHWMR